MVNKAQVARRAPAKKFRVLKEFGNSNTINAMATIDVRAKTTNPLFTNVELTHVDVKHIPLESSLPTSAETGHYTLASIFWGCDQMAQLYQKFTLLNVKYKYVPSVAYTWSGSVAAKIVTDPLDNGSSSTLNNFLNAPSSMLTPIYLPSQTMTYFPRQGTKMCYSTNTITSSGNQFAEGVVSPQEYLTSRQESYGKFQFMVFDPFQPDGSAPPDGTLVGRFILTATLRYIEPVPIGNTIKHKVAIYTPIIQPLPPQTEQANEQSNEPA